MIRGVELKSYYNDKIIEIAEEACGPAVSSSAPHKADIGFNKLIVHFKGTEYSFERVYSYEKFYPHTRIESNKQEVIEPRYYILTFKNPYDSEKPISRAIQLEKEQDIAFWFIRVWKWIKIRENSLWVINILVLIFNIIALFLNHK